MLNRIHSLFWACLLAAPTVSAQSSSLLWEISGHGLSKPSYLFGTMHVSNKMAFNLNDSFYDALRRIETVCLEVNPETWQEDMYDMESRKARILEYGSAAGNDFLYESSLRLRDHMPLLKMALQKQPSSINLLLYRSKQVQDDFEEDTYLDMHIYQTGRRMGKKATGLENYARAEKMMMEALAAMGKEIRPATSYDEATPVAEVMEKLEDAYRQGDLEKIDSLDRSMYRSEAFREIFIVRRNEIQARAIDSLLKTTSVFAGIGAAHLPGDRGVISLLRKMGYVLRPVMVSGQSASRKNGFDSIIVPGNWSVRYSEDGLISADMPGPWFRTKFEPTLQDQWQYADMPNGAYYSMTRVTTYAAFRHLTASEIRKKTDSLLYENVPGKILQKTFLDNRVFPGLEVISRNRRGDMQRLQVFFTPFEAIFLKVSGPVNYMQGPGPDCFFSSVQFHPGSGDLSPEFNAGAFAASMPGWKCEKVQVALLPSRREYLSVDSTTGHAYLLFRSDVHQFGLLGEDSIDLRLMEASFFEPGASGRVVARQWTKLQGYPALYVREVMGDSSLRETSFVIKGPQYYVWSVRHPIGELSHEPMPVGVFLSVANTHPQAEYVEDTVLQFRAKICPQPPIDEELRRLGTEVSELPLNLFQSAGSTRYWPLPRTGILRDQSTGEMAMLQWQAFPEYYQIRDTAVFWQQEIQTRSRDADLYLHRPPVRLWRNGQPGIQFELRDTGSSRTVHHQLLLDEKGLLSLTFLGDTLSVEGPMLSSLANTLTTLSAGSWKDRLESRLPAFFRVLRSTDSLASEKALQAIREMYFGMDAISAILESLDKLDPAGRNYDLMKSRLIAELGDIRETGGNRVVKALENIYKQVSDTVIFQQEVVRALTRHRTTAAYRLLSRIMVQDPPVFENDYEYKNLFFNLHDSLQLSAQLFPQILPLYSSEGIKPAMLSLLAELVDSGYVPPSAYKSYFDAILVDARVELKKLRAKDEKAVFDQSKNAKDNQVSRVFNEGGDERLLDFARLLIPFYRDQAVVRDFFTRLLQTRNEPLRITVIGMMAGRKFPVADSLLLHLAANDRYRSELWKRLEKAGATSIFPRAYQTQEWLARSELMSEFAFDRMDSISLLGQQLIMVSGVPGRVYFFKYRAQPQDSWKLGISGLQPGDLQKVSAGKSIVSLTDTRINDRDPVDIQIVEPFRKWLLASYPSGRKFYQEIMPYQFIQAGIHDIDE